MPHASRRTLGAAALVVALLVAKGARADVPAFPGAEGFGAYATGGRGGRVLKVTSLASEGEGSLRWALAQPGPRIIVFAVSGVIVGDHRIVFGDVTVAGQSAPGAGITLAGRLLGADDPSVGNIILRHLRIRPPIGEPGGEYLDSLQLSENHTVMLDHLSVSWGIDETVDLFAANQVTLQWSTIEESAMRGHPEGPHNHGLIQGPGGSALSVHHNLFAHHASRCPAVARGPAEVINNLVYNVHHGFVHNNPASGPFNIHGNAFVRGPDAALIPFFFDDEDGPATLPSYYLHDNFIDDPGKLVGVVDDPWAERAAHPGLAELGAGADRRAIAPHDFRAVPGYLPVSSMSSRDVRAKVLARAGAFPRDATTLRIIEEVRARGGGWGVWGDDHPTLAGLTPRPAPEDRDDDGMADAWERARGLDPDDPHDHAKRMPSGYTAIEDYLNELAGALIGEAGPIPVPAPDPDPEPAGGGCAAAPARPADHGLFVLAALAAGACLRRHRQAKRRLSSGA